MKAVNPFQFNDFMAPVQQVETPVIAQNQAVQTQEENTIQEAVQAILVEPPAFEVPPVVMITEIDLANANQEGFSKGYSQARQELNAEANILNQKIADCLEKINIQLAITFTNQYENFLKLEEAMIAIAVKIGKKIAGSALKDNFKDEILTIVQKSLLEVKGESQITISVNSSLEQFIQQRLAEIVAKSGFQGQITLKGNDRILETDCVVEWQNGQLVSNKEKILQQIESVI